MAPWRKAARQVLPLLMTAFALAGCSQKGLLEKFSSPEDRALSGIVIQDLRAGPSGDADLAARMMPELAQKLGPELPRMRALMPSDPKASSRLVDASVNVMEGGGHTTRSAYLGYEVDGSAGQRALVRLAILRRDGAPKITGLFVNPLYKPVEQIGAFSLAGKPPIAYLILAMAVLSALTIVASEIMLFRTRWIRLKWLWAVGCLFGFGLIAVNWETGALAFQAFNIQLLGAFAVRPGMLAPWQVGFGVPIPSIAFLLLRRRLQKPPASTGSGEAAVETF